MQPDGNLPCLPQAEPPSVASREEGEDALSPEDELFHHLMVASPCDASWEDMEGDGLVRFCRHCHRNVYNLSGMVEREAAAWVRETEEQLCIRFYRRPDGTLLANDCPVGWRAVRTRLLQIGATVAASGVAGSFAGLLFGLFRASHLHGLPIEAQVIFALGGGLIGLSMGCALAVTLSLSGCLWCRDPGRSPLAERARRSIEHAKRHRER
jgi:hypothetical protein